MLKTSEWSIDYFFPDVFSFGTFDVPADAFTQWESIYVPRITAAITNDRRATTQLFSVTRAAADSTDIKTAIETARDVLFYSIWGTPDLIATTGGIPYDNRFTIYLGLTNNVALNLQVERIRGDRQAEGYARTFYQTTGDLDRPPVTLHNILDPIVPFEHELIYRALVAPEHNSRFLTVRAGSGLWPLRLYHRANFGSLRTNGAAGEHSDTLRFEPAAYSGLMASPVTTTVCVLKKRPTPLALPWVFRYFRARCG